MGSQSQLDQVFQMGALIHLLHLLKLDALCAEETSYVLDAHYL